MIGLSRSWQSPDCIWYRLTFWPLKYIFLLMMVLQTVLTVLDSKAESHRESLLHIVANMVCQIVPWFPTQYYCYITDPKAGDEHNCTISALLVFSSLPFLSCILVFSAGV